MQPEIMGNWPELNEQPIFTLDLKKRNWRYRGEGNANLVLALPDECLVLRFHKYDREKTFSERERIEEFERALQEAVFCDSVMVPLIGRAYIRPPKLAVIDQSQIQSLENVLDHYQPAHRRHKGIKFGNVTIYPDYTVLPHKSENMINMNDLLGSDLQDHSLLNNPTFRTPNQIKVHRIVFGDVPTPSNENQLSVQQHFDIPVPGLGRRTFKRSKPNETKSSIFCVEIKPKQGWIPDVDRSKPKCTYCLTQYLKLSEGNIDKISEYCPLDLFSGDVKRMRKAIKALLMQPQNNLKIFKDGDLIYSDSVQNDLSIILKEMFQETSSILQLDDFGSIVFYRAVEKFANLVHQVLTTDGTDETETVLQVEDLDGTAIPLPSTQTDPHPTQSCKWTSLSLPKNCVLDRIMKIQQLQQFGIEDVYKMYRNIGPVAHDYAYVKSLCNQREPKKLLLNPIQRYLLATSAKDCSILIAFKQLSEGDTCCVGDKMLTDVHGQRFVWNVGVSDLDPKPFSCIEKHWKRNSNVLSAYNRFVKSM
ncbi:inositol-pentakisphosphate 2-kinase [Nilaparvata lugens]|uniref:inositol-pentakisphosphate 2-kinase n=1 Tax=Nilaparvata lugens TaxID=108931 RepID=UPI00193D0235|nr:inositol-pentakisphosphate 2-kinase [Nilaparvata lugens]